MDSDDPYAPLVLDLDGEGSGGFYRVRNRPDELNRGAAINRGEKFQVVADIVEVTHGSLSMEPNGTAGVPGVLIVADFQFVPKQGRRYKGATIKFTFTSDDPLVEVSVERIGPSGRWSKYPTTRNDASSWKLSPSVGAAGVDVSLGDVSNAKEQTKTFHTFVTGTIRMETRDEGGKDTAQWVLEENEAQKTGIARFFRVAILAKLDVSPERKTPEPPQFQATVEAITTVPFMSRGWAEEKIEVVRKKVPVDDPIKFKCGVNRESGLFKFDKKSLRGEDLTKIMAMNLYHSFEDLNKATRESGSGL
ncbi:hypothetical protein GGTG_06991 [Gaeumannomyces tritici R3-111a-1]|uniref:Uncharacterized protein n=1 Tax=Gaeumannomyces tritici (strain R3-111a-1) TaxID=644352 RepID=J3P0E4_GAET3|nr:hypothetical protein GGTG_06991 [Gaeumannomyces tritici R3-111a-1]EJT77077.1 hypothetical protein GGTG_06991 [Gaeumannomyces tritici R3-111a-1]